MIDYYQKDFANFSKTNALNGIWRRASGRHPVGPVPNLPGVSQPQQADRVRKYIPHSRDGGPFKKSARTARIVRGFLVGSILIVGLSIGTVFGQDLRTSRQTSYDTYIYQLTDEQAVAIYQEGLKVVNESYFHTLIDQYPTDSLYTTQLPYGHYLKTWSKGEELLFELFSETNVSVKILNNGTDLNLLVHDSLGQVVPGARVRLRKKRVPFDPVSQAYRLKKTNRQGLLTVKHQGETSFFYVERELNNGWVRRISRKVLYRTPIKYFWVPVSLVLSSPLDLYRSVRQKYPTGLFYYVYQPFQTIYRSIAYDQPQGFVEKVFCFFDKDYCDEYYYPHHGYTALNKPMYRPGDTVRYKVYMLNHRQKPMKEPLELWLSPYNAYHSENGKPQKLGVITPYRPGGYEGEFVLHDSLNLTLDQDYELSWGEDQHSSFSRRGFRYEDYELSAADYALRVAHSEHHWKTSNTIYAKGTDSNGLSLLDGYVEITVTAQGAGRIFDSSLFVPDTLWTHQQALEPSGETEISLPDSIFPKANLTYWVNAIFYNSERDQVTQSEEVDYFYQLEKLKTALRADTIHIERQRDGQSVASSAIWRAYDEQEQLVFSREITLPAAVPVSPFVFRYEAVADSLVASLLMPREEALVQLLSERTHDSLTLALTNPRRLPINYTIYRKNQEIARGRDTELRYAIRTTTEEKYFVALQYVWGDKVQHRNYEIPFREKQLTVQAYQPTTVYPGQAPEIRVRVTDAEAQPVANADVTAYGLTRKFEDYRPPQLPYLGKTYPDRTLINNFHQQEQLNETAAINLQWQRWNARMHLDSIAYYQFLYPSSGRFVSYQATPDSSTQFAPFVVEKGALQPVHIIYLDERPIYLSMATQQHYYAFLADSGYHHLRLRTAHHEISLDSVYLRPGVKNVLSFRIDAPPAGLSVQECEPMLTDHEYTLVNRYLLVVENNFKDHEAYLTQQNQTFWLRSSKPQEWRRSDQLITGPLSGAQDARFVLTDHFETAFRPEPSYTHEFRPGLLKLRSRESVIGRNLSEHTREQALGDVALTEERLFAQLQDETAQRQAYLVRYLNPKQTQAGWGRIGLLVSSALRQSGYMMKNVVLLKDDEPGFVRVYPGNDRVLHDLLPNQYRMLLLLQNNDYMEIPSVAVQANGTTYLRIGSNTITTADSVSKRINEMIKKHLAKDAFSSLEEKENLRDIGNTYFQDQFTTVIGGNEVYGYVIDEQDRAYVPGVNILVKGTRIGTVTDIDGYYRLTIPPDATTLVFSSVGYVTQEVDVTVSRSINVTMEADIQQLSEIVVVGYGTQERRDIVGSSVVVDASLTLQGRVAGVAVSEKPIRIRGNNTIAGDDQPLYVIDGVPYTGSDFDLDPANIASMEVLTVEAAMGLYGSRAAQGAILITTKANEQGVNALFASATMLEAAQMNPLRSNFSDYAFWEPTVRTDAQGIARFTAHFPDDVTAWRTFFLAMSGRQESGQTSGEIKAYKPVMGTLAGPRFLVEGDTTYLIGKALNYTGDTLKLTTTWQIPGQTVPSQTINTLHAIVDTAQAVARTTDSLAITFQAAAPDGYSDGELRKIPVYRSGTVETKGSFHRLENDTTLTLTFDTLGSEVTLYAQADLLEVALDEIEYVHHYAYLCNEQIASKIKVLVLEKQIRERLNQAFKHDKAVQKLVKQLEKNQQTNGLWGWWEASEPSLWISLHTVEALLAAQQAGFAVNFSRQPMIDFLVQALESKQIPDETLRILRLLDQLEARVDRERYLKPLEQDSKLTLAQQLSIILLRQRSGEANDALDRIVQQRQETMLGQIYWADTTFQVMQNTMQTTLLAYRALRNSGKYHDYLPSIRSYLIAQRPDGHWRNTYESAQVLTTLLPDILTDRHTLDAPSLMMQHGQQSQTVRQFPFSRAIAPRDTVVVRKQGTGLVYLTAYQPFFQPHPQAVVGDFTVQTHFENATTTLSAGESVTLMVDVEVKKQANYVMIEVPIPAGCSYAEKGNHQPYEVHREYFKEKTSIFCHQLLPGQYQFKIALLPRFTGSYTLNPARAELMYFPLFYGRNEKQVVTVTQ